MASGPSSCPLVSPVLRGPGPGHPALLGAQRPPAPEGTACTDPRPGRSPTLRTCCLMIEGTITIMITPSTAHSSPAKPSAATTRRALERLPMSARPGARALLAGLRACGGTEAGTEVTEAATPRTRAAAARRARDRSARRSGPAGGQRFYVPSPGRTAPGTPWAPGSGRAPAGGEAGRGLS